MVSQQRDSLLSTRALLLSHQRMTADGDFDGGVLSLLEKAKYRQRGPRSMFRQIPSYTKTKIVTMGVRQRGKVSETPGAGARREGCGTRVVLLDVFRGNAACCAKPIVCCCLGTSLRRATHIMSLASCLGTTDTPRGEHISGWDFCKACIFFLDLISKISRRCTHLATTVRSIGQVDKERDCSSNVSLSRRSQVAGGRVQSSSSVAGGYISLGGV